MSNLTISHALGYSLAAASLGIGGAGLALFGAFLWNGPLLSVNLDLEAPTALAVNGLLSVAFFAQHSGMVRRRWQRFLATWISPVYVPALYSVASGAVLMVMVLYWQDVGVALATARGWAHWAVRGGWLVGGAIMLWSWRSLTSLDALGVGQILSRERPQPETPTEFHVAGPYRWVRHPMYLATLMLIWGHPAPTIDRLLFNVLWSLWVVVGAHWEERDLVESFGDHYRAYQTTVPMILPYRRP